jgi:hypothetical protein
MEFWRDLVFAFVDKNLEKNRGLIYVLAALLCGSCAYFLYSLDRSFRVHQVTIERILRCNARDGIFCQKVHVGHDGTTLEFGTIPKEVGTAGTIDPSASLSPVDVGHLITIPFFPSFFWISCISLVCLVLLIISFLFIRKNKNSPYLRKK